MAEGAKVVMALGYLQFSVQLCLTKFYIYQYVGMMFGLALLKVYSYGLRKNMVLSISIFSILWQN